MNIPEDEFKKNLFEWVEQMDISKELQSKLRSDLFQNFGKTVLGRQIAAQYQQSQRMVLSPLVLVINTLVAEFLYAQNCHFSLSVFSSEVPYKNVLPDFEKVNKFRFDAVELDEIIKALALDHSDVHKSEIVKTYKTPQERDGTQVDTSLLFCIIRTLSQAVSTNALPRNDVQLPTTHQPQSQDVDSNCHHCKSNGKRTKKDELHSKYYKHFYKYLELLSQHVVEISENTKKLNEPTKSDEQHSKSSLKTCQLNRRLDKITETLTNLSKSNRKGRKVTEIIKSITRLTNEIERCSKNVAKYSIAIQSTKDATKNVKSPINYTEWLNQMTESSFGQRFIKNLETAQEKAIANEVHRIKENFNEKFQTTRKLMKFHYKQKTFEKFRATMLRSPVMQSRRDDFNELIDEKLRLLKEKENYWKQNLLRASVQTTPNHELLRNPPIPTDVHNSAPTGSTNEPVFLTNSSKVQLNIHPFIKSKKAIDMEIFNEPIRPIEPVIDDMVLIAKNRLHELEIESEQLDKSFQSYLKKQNEQKRVLANDIDKVWRQYERAKDNMIKRFVVPERRHVATNINFHENVCPIPIQISTDEPIIPPIRSESNQFKNPYKVLHANLTMTGSLDSTITKKEIAIEAKGSVPTLTLQENERIKSADKVSQIPIPMKIKSIIKKPLENESTTHLRISTSNDNPLSDPSDASSYMNLKNVSLSDVGHLSDSKPSDRSVKSKHSEISSNSPGSIRSERLRNGLAVMKKTNVEQAETVANGIITVQTDTVAKRQSGAEVTIETGCLADQHNADTKDISSFFERIEIQNNSRHSTSPESSVGRKISTGNKSTSSDEFWK